MSFRYLEFQPPPSLDLIVRGAFFARGRISYGSEKILPTGLIPVLFNAGRPHRLGKSATPGENDSFTHGWVEGFQTTPNYHTPTDGTHVMGLLFEPPGFHALFGADMRSIRDRTLDVDDVLPAELVAMVAPLVASATEAAVHERVFAFLSALPVRPLPGWLWSIYREIRDRRGAVDLGDCYARHAVSGRQATTAFTRAVGVSPKKLCRVHRLLALLEAIDPTRPVNWTDLAHRFGFYDQAHFNHEFRRLAGLHPGEYLAQRRDKHPELGQGDSVPFVPVG